ncbi:hypothetical protein QBC34DRAFT_410412 [Podospora aff. communis PSN243]|uniref:Uncharacterized protein n=1 Tax=Podospora aff. communis PSN243 TaxID=3040156 RepID=A0AAV9GFT6_9PEZI|nr:hypothetical protein QBC34DRAFT_410412 [Podospora aff. communis PSN243]
MPWNRLPFELRLMVYDHVLDELDSREPSYSYATSGILQFNHEARRDNVGYVLVCKEWQDHFEAGTFRHLHIDQYRISDLDRFTERVPRRKKLVKFIHFTVKLPEYDCGVRLSEETPEEKSQNIAVFQRPSGIYWPFFPSGPLKERIPRTPRSLSTGSLWRLAPSHQAIAAMAAQTSGSTTGIRSVRCVMSSATRPLAGQRRVATIIYGDRLNECILDHWPWV